MQVRRHRTLFLYSQVVRNCSKLKPSARGELEITDVNRVYLERNELNVCVMGRGMAWLRPGTHDALTEASLFIQTLEKQQVIIGGMPRRNCIPFRPCSHQTIEGVGSTDAQQRIQEPTFFSC